MYKWFMLLSLACWINVSAISQSLNNKDIIYLRLTVSNFLAKKETMKENEERKSEFLTLLIQIDSTGNVSDLKIIADPMNLDSTYEYLGELRPSHFSDWKCNLCKGKTIMMPIASFSQSGKPEYVNRFKDSKVVTKAAVISEANSLIILSVLRYYAPITEENKNQ